MLLKNCPKCKKIMPYGKQYCPDCTLLIEQEREQYKAERNRRYNRQREPKYEQFYHSKPWKLLSAKRLSVDKHCVFCGKPATEVDHIIEIQTPEGWALRLTGTIRGLFATNVMISDMDGFNLKRDRVVEKSFHLFALQRAKVHFAQKTPR